MANASQHRHRGFTLIELLIVVTVIAILTAIAVPMYRDFVVRSNRSDAIIALTELANLEEKYYSNELAYTTTIADLSYPATSANDYYELNITSSASVDYILTATPLGQQLAEDNACQQFSLNSFGQRGAVDGGANDTTQECWRR
ncbi:MAG: Fimbrial protein [Gammaproteobacteria bacterium]|nr:Fimbrial protein [Gammaproteobacteria bacterium]